VPTQVVGTTATTGQVEEEATPESAIPEPLTSTATAIREVVAPSEATEENATTELFTSEQPTPKATATLVPTTGQNIIVLTESPPPLLTPVLTPSPAPSPTFVPLSSLDENLQTIIYTTQGEQGPEIWRVQVDEQGQQAGPIERMNLPTHRRTSIYDLFPSPDGQKVAVSWAYEGGITTFDILDIATGQPIPSFEAQTDPHNYKGYFLDWSPDSQNILVIGAWGTDLPNSMWLVDANNVYREIVKLEHEYPFISSASFSPDGKMIAYNLSDCYECGSQIWRVTLDTLEQQLLFEDSRMYVSDVLWSPDGDYIAFTQWLVESASDDVVMGQLHIITPDGKEERTLSPVATNYAKELFRPAFSPDGQQIAFVIADKAEFRVPLDALSSNVYIANVRSGQVNQLTQFQNTRVLKPNWAPDGSQVAFIAGLGDSASQLGIWMIAVNDRELHRIDVGRTLIDMQSDDPGIQSSSLGMQSAITWLP
jgi:Tol biopolymer transport system component